MWNNFKRGVGAAAVPDCTAALVFYMCMSLEEYT